MDVESIRHAYLRCFVAPVFRACGFGLTRGVARRLAAGVVRLEPPGRRRAADRVAAALGLEAGDATVAERVSAIYRHQGDFWAEALFVGRFLKDGVWQGHVRVDGESRLQALAGARQGCVLTTAYYGNPAVAACVLGRLFRPVHVVVDWISTPSLRAWQREMYRMPFVEPVGRTEAARRIPDILERGGAVLLIAEHERRRGPAAEVRFLGRRLRLYPTIARLARWFDVPIVPVVCRRVGGTFRFVLEFGEAIGPSQKKTSTSTRSGAPAIADPSIMAGALAGRRITRSPPQPVNDDARTMRLVMASLERLILREPNQYLWSIETLGGAPQGGRAGRKPAEGGRATTTEMETETGSSRRSRRRTSASQWRSAAGRPPAAGAGAVEAGPAPTA